MARVKNKNVDIVSTGKAISAGHDAAYTEYPSASVSRDLVVEIFLALHWRVIVVAAGTRRNNPFKPFTRRTGRPYFE